MLPWKPFPSSCIPVSNFLALMSTAVALTAAATFWCTRRFTCPQTCKAASTKADGPVAKPQADSSTAPSNVNNESLSFLCNSCGLQKYSPDELEAFKSSESGKSPFKMVILVRTDLNMGKGKAAAQCCHAVLAAFKTASSRQSEALKRWEREGQPKVTLKVESEDEMVELMKKARMAGLVAESIFDAGRTQVAAGTQTVCAIGPGPAKLIDTVTGHLKLY